eukprot:UN17520
MPKKCLKEYEGFLMTLYDNRTMSESNPEIIVEITDKKLRYSGISSDDCLKIINENLTNLKSVSNFKSIKVFNRKDIVTN